jgi:dTDP-glucose 4,6-dehydratase
MAATITDGTRQVLEVAARSRSRVLFLSSGAVYGRQAVQHVAEDASTGPDPMDPRSAYGQAKRLAETLCAAATAAGDASVVVARLFTFIGPRLPLSAHFAAGNFLADAGMGRPVSVHGDGRAVRSYLYAGDFPEWAWALLARGEGGRAYNVGSAQAVTIAELAAKVAEAVTPATTIEILGTPSAGTADRYVPDVARAAHELGVEPRTGLVSAIEKSLHWLCKTGALPINR